MSTPPNLPNDRNPDDRHTGHPVPPAPSPAPERVDMVRINFAPAPRRGDGFGSGGGGGHIVGRDAVPLRPIVEGTDFTSKIVADELRLIQEWARDNRSDAKKDRAQFWMLKIPAILGGLGASALESFGYGPAVIIVGFVTSVCVAVDGLHPRGRLYNVHKRAANELFALQDRVATQINQSKLGSSTGELSREQVAQIIKEAQTEKERIGRYITEAEASLGEEPKPRSN